MAKEAGMSIEDKLNAAKDALQQWVDKQGHEQCWYYPEIFRELCGIFGVTASLEPNLPPRTEFKQGCIRYEGEVYEAKDSLPVVYK